ncbi:MAG: hypothetical protein DRP00_01460 [Candidatus Aenigmatarchaeota archaeon]|nr:MAG: hypothetical protein DRP00_01460 [Candidatus Aenigmarchaeota archaeon]
MEFSEKALLALIIPFAFGIVFPLFELYVQLDVFWISALELFVFSIPFYFFLLETPDAFLAFPSAFIFITTKGFIKGYILGKTFCLVDSLIFPIAFTIYAGAIAFHRESAFKEARLGLLSTFLLILAFSIALFIWIVYKQYVTVCPYAISPREVLGFPVRLSSWFCRRFEMLCW